MRIICKHIKHLVFGCKEKLSPGLTGDVCKKPHMTWDNFSDDNIFDYIGEEGFICKPTFFVIIFPMMYLIVTCEKNRSHTAPR